MKILAMYHIQNHNLLLMKGLDVLRIREKLGMTQEELAQKLDLSSRTIQNYETKMKEKEIPTKAQRLIERTFSDRARKSVSEPDRSNAQRAEGKAILNVPLVHQYAYAGYMSGFGDPEYVEHLPTHPFTVDDRNYKGKYLAFEVRGDSMNDGSIESCPDRSIVLAREIQRQHWVNKLHINKYVFVIVHKTDGIMIKKIINHDVERGVLTLHSLNEMYEDYEVELDNVAQIFNVVKRVLD